MRTIATPNDMKQHIGEEFGVSEWVTVDQEMIDKFADATGDHQWIQTGAHERHEPSLHFQRS